MATRLFFLNDPATTQHWDGSMDGLSESTFLADTFLNEQGGWSSRALSTVRGLSATSRARSSVAGPHAGIELKQFQTYQSGRAGNTWMQWFSAPFNEAAAVSGTIDCNVWGKVTAATESVASFPSGSGTTAGVGTWTDAATGTNADDGTRANLLLISQNQVGSLTVSGFDFSSIPSGSTITAVYIEAQTLNDFTGGTTRHVIRLGSTDGALNDAATNTTEFVESFGPLTRPGGGSWTRSDLTGGTLSVRIEGRQPGGGAGNQDRNYQWDYVKVIAYYTVPIPVTAAINVVLDKMSYIDGTITQIAKSTNSTPLTTTSAAYAFNMTATTTPIERGDRLRARIFFDDATGGSMPTGLTLEASFSGPTSLALGDSWIEFTANYSFVNVDEAAVTTWYLLDFYKSGGAVSSAVATKIGFTDANVMKAQTDVEIAARTFSQCDVLLYLYHPDSDDEAPIDGYVFDTYAGAHGYPSEDAYSGLGIGRWRSDEFAGSITLGGVARVKAHAFTRSGYGSGMHAKLYYWNGTGYTLWAASQMSPAEAMNSVTYGAAIGHLAYTFAVGHDHMFWAYMVGPETLVPEGGHLMLEVMVDDSYRDIASFTTIAQPGGGTEEYVFFDFNGGTNAQPIRTRLELTETLVQPALDQVTVRGRNDDGSETTATWKAANNIGWVQDFDENFRVRFSIDEVGGADPASTVVRLQYKAPDGNWYYVSSITDVRLALSTHFADGDATTNQLGAALDGGTYVAGTIHDTAAVAPAFNLATFGKTELEWSLEAVSGGSIDPGDTINFRVVQDIVVALPSTPASQPVLDDGQGHTDYDPFDTALWEHISGSGPDVAVYVGDRFSINDFIYSPDPPAYYRYRGLGAMTDMDVYLKIATVGLYNDPWWACGVRVQEGSDDGLWFRIIMGPGTGHKIQLYRRQSGAETLIWDPGFWTTFVANDYMRFRIVGTAVSWYKNSSLITSATLTGAQTVFTSGRLGLGLWTGGGSAPLWAADDFGGGGDVGVETLERYGGMPDITMAAAGTGEVVSIAAKLTGGMRMSLGD